MGASPGKPVDPGLKQTLWMVAADIAVFAALLLAFAYFHHVRPRRFTPVDLRGADGQLFTDAPTPALTPEPAGEALLPASVPELSYTLAPTFTPEPTADPNDPLGGRFAEMFSLTGEAEWTDNTYRSSKVSVTVDTFTRGDAKYAVADIYLRDVQCFRSAVAQEHDWRLSRASVAEMSLWNGAVAAISGDFFAFRSSGVIAVRNGREWLNLPPVSSDLMAMYYDGTMEVYYASQGVDLDAIYNRGVYQLWCFGPVLLDGGQAPQDYNSTVAGRNPRSAVGYYEPGHYCFVVVDGRQSGYSEGMTLKELTALFQELGCTLAYNLDGGDTAAMTFHGGIYSHPDGEPRDVSDILYIGEPIGENEG